MQISKSLLLISLFFILSFCKNNKQVVREPISHTRSMVDMQSVNQNRSLNKREEDYIAKMIAQDSLHHYIDSGHGFWYYYLKQNPNGLPVKTDDHVILNYSIKDLGGNYIYTADEIGQKTYWVDHENYFRGFHEAVKLLKQGETAVFVFPSNAAYGYHGDEQKIGANIPLIVQLKILKINKHKNK